MCLITVCLDLGIFEATFQVSLEKRCASEVMSSSEEIHTKLAINGYLLQPLFSYCLANHSGHEQVIEITMWLYVESLWRVINQVFSVRSAFSGSTYAVVHLMSNTMNFSYISWSCRQCHNCTSCHRCHSSTPLADCSTISTGQCLRYMSNSTPFAAAQSSKRFAHSEKARHHSLDRDAARPLHYCMWNCNPFIHDNQKGPIKKRRRPDSISESIVAISHECHRNYN